MITSVQFCYPYYFQKVLPSFHLLPLFIFPSSLSSFLIFNFTHRERFTQIMARNHIQFKWYCSFVKHYYLHLHCLLHLSIFFTYSAYYIIKQLLTWSLDMMWYRPENTNIDFCFAFATVNTGILWSTLHLIIPHMNFPCKTFIRRMVKILTITLR